MRVQIVAVFVPGLLLVVEGWVVYESPGVGVRDLLVKASNKLDGVSPFVAAVAVVVAGFVVYTIGTLSRNTAWFGWANVLNRWARFSTKRGLLDDVNTFYSVPQVQAVLDKHPALSASLTHSPKSDREAFDPPHRYPLAYCKLWLIRYAPEFSVRHFEPEINLLVGLLIPILGLAFVATRAAGFVWGAVAFVFAIAVDCVFLFFVHRRQREELFQALSHFLIAHWSLTAEDAIAPRSRLAATLS